MARVVCTGIDLQLMKTRKMILERAGHVVMIAINEPELLAACENHDVDVAVIGRALSFRQDSRALRHPPGKSH